jgi:hypothetical protein
MAKRGCTFTGESCLVIIEKCEGCNRIVEFSSGRYCKVYPDPASRWAYGISPTASHMKKEIKEVVQKLNPLKASKRGKK